jgi:transposase-like protein
VFSYDDRMRAVLLYIKYDRRAAATVRDLGYPTTKTLKKWYREYVAQGDLQVTKTRKGKFTSDEARVAVDYYLEHGRCISATVRALGYPSRETLRQWIQERCPAIRATSVQRRRDEPFSEERETARRDRPVRTRWIGDVGCQDVWCEPDASVHVAAPTTRRGCAYREKDSWETSRSHRAGEAST